MNHHLWLGLAVVSAAAACAGVDGAKHSAIDRANDAGVDAAREPGDAVAPADDGAALLFASPRCTSGVTRDPNESEGPEMNPGHACIACHSAVIATGDDAPSFSFAGTAFPTGHEPDNCAGSGSEGAVITVTDAAGQTFAATANAVGNFFVEDAAPKFPITATIELGGRKRRMTAPQMSGDCNSCHTAEGAEGAPGRITVP